MDPLDLSAWLSDAAKENGGGGGGGASGAGNSENAAAEAAQRLSAELLRASQEPDGCVRLRGGGAGDEVFEAAAGLLYGRGSWEDESAAPGNGCCPSPHRTLPRLSVRRRAAVVLRNLARAQCADPRERRLLRQLDRVRLHCDCVRAALCRCGALPRGQPADSEEAREHCSEALASLLELSYSPPERVLLARLGGVECLADLLLADYCQSGLSPPPASRFLRRCAACALTNLSYGDPVCKHRLCRRGPALRCLTEQLSAVPTGHPPDPELCQAAAAVLRNLSWQADPACRVVLSRIGAAASLARAAVRTDGADEATLRSLLSALWNLTAHSPVNQASVCDVPNALACLCRCLAAASLAESAGGVLRNLGHVVASHEHLRTAVRPALPLLLRHLLSSSPTIAANACCLLRSLSAGHPADARLLCRLGAASPLRRLLQSRHRVIADACAAALANLAPASAAAHGSELDAAACASLPRLRRPTPLHGHHRPEDPLLTASFPAPGGPCGLSGGSGGGGGFGPLAMSAWERQGRAERGLYPLLEEAPATPEQPVGFASVAPASAAASASATEAAAPTGSSASSDIELSDLSASLSSVIEIDAAAMVRGSRLACDTDLDEVEDDNDDGDRDSRVGNEDKALHGTEGGFDLSTPSSPPSTLMAPSFLRQPQSLPSRRSASSSLPVRAPAAPVSHLPLPSPSASQARGAATSTVAAFSTLPRRRPQLLNGGSLPRRRQARAEEAPLPKTSVPPAVAAAVAGGGGNPRMSGPSPLPATRLPVLSACAVSASAPPAKKKPLGVVAPTVVRPPTLPPPAAVEVDASGGRSPPSRSGLPHCRLSSLSKDSGYADSLLSNSASLTPVGGCGREDEETAATATTVAAACGSASPEAAASAHLRQPPQPPQQLLTAPKSRATALTAATVTASQTRPARKPGSGIPVKSPAVKPTARSEEAATVFTGKLPSSCNKKLPQKQPPATPVYICMRQTTNSSNARRIKWSRSAPPS